MKPGMEMEEAHVARLDKWEHEQYSLKEKKARPCQSYQNPKTGPGTDAHLSPEKRLKRPRKAKEGI